MKTIIPIIALFLAALFTACKKKEAALPTSMTVVVDDDTAFVTTNVTTDNESNSPLYINSTSTDGKQRFNITISNFQNKKGTFDIDYHGYTITTAQYFNGGNLSTATTGGIVISAVEDGVIKGYFTIYAQQIKITGSFTAPQK